MEAVILAGGRGTRLQGVVSDVPKCLAPVAGRPFLDWLLAWLCQYPVDHVVFSVGYLKEQVIRFVTGREWPFRYHFAEEDSPLGTGGGIRLALSLCEEEQVLVLNGDTFFPVELDRMPFDATVTVALKAMQQAGRYGTVELQGRQIRAFREKAACAEGLVSGGIYAIRRSRLALDGLPACFSFEREVLEPGAAAGIVNGWECDDYFIDIGIEEDYRKAQEEIPAWFALQRVSSRLMASDASFLFLDRDGVVNRHLPGEYVRIWDQFQFMPGFLPELRRWSGKFQRIVLVTNQRGVGKGLMTDEDLSRIHARMMMAVLDAGARIDLILACTALDENHPDRKPNPGMFRQACTLFPEITAERSIMTGDAPSDAAFAANCGMSFVPFL